MTEPSAASAWLAASGLTFFGISTGLDPAVLIAGFAGGVWAQSYQDPMPPWRRLALVVLASILAGYLAPTLAAFVLSFSRSPGAVTHEALRLPIAVLLGLTSHKVLGPAVMKFATKRAEDLTK